MWQLFNPHELWQYFTHFCVTNNAFGGCPLAHTIACSYVHHYMHIISAKLPDDCQIMLYA